MKKESINSICYSPNSNISLKYTKPNFHKFMSNNIAN